MTQITVREIVPPRPGGKQYSLIDTAGQRWGVYADHIHDYQIGGVYSVVRSKENHFNGKLYVTLEEAEFIGMDGSQSAPQQVVATPRQTPPTPRQTYAPPRAASASRAVTAAPAFDDARRLDIFICGAFNNIMSNPNVHPQTLKVPELISIITSLSAAWRHTIGKGRTLTDEMNDEIPDLGGQQHGSR